MNLEQKMKQELCRELVIPDAVEDRRASWRERLCFSV